MTTQHKELENGKWAEFSLAEQLAHIGSEISRAALWHSKNKKEQCANAVFRGLELIDFTINNLQSIKRFSAIKEITRLRETVCDYFLYDNRYNTDIKGLIKYFDAFALAVALKKQL